MRQVIFLYFPFFNRQPVITNRAVTSNYATNINVVIINISYHYQYYTTVSFALDAKWGLTVLRFWQFDGIILNLASQQLKLHTEFKKLKEIKVSIYRALHKLQYVLEKNTIVKDIIR